MQSIFTLMFLIPTTWGRRASSLHKAMCVAPTAIVLNGASIKSQSLKSLAPRLAEFVWRHFIDLHPPGRWFLRDFSCRPNHPSSYGFDQRPLLKLCGAAPALVPSRTPRSRAVRGRSGRARLSMIPRGEDSVHQRSCSVHWEV